jgi:hypothetical protein
MVRKTSRKDARLNCLPEQRQWVFLRENGELLPELPRTLLAEAIEAGRAASP